MNDLLITLVTALHMGALHPHEKALTLALAFGPFVVLGAVVAVRRRQDAREAGEQEARAEGQRDR
ncbi:Na+-translocating ferredoxin:NAD+ oxidoreductase RnfE subunit [Nocardioides ginsengisegetis]|uniref:Na+-translocating ferredoxin:NAD+ oxidoreductase RnfE subunit n=1 Tax=Nocardioides ginsengisegetis TaxID=661491 RepID=A0A7W3PAH1_9ACTN|nr:hypothetical protein [Nocardioides ginsengisegetis]MBA8804447.1 Na+-translocating ferredoxin:NAD+ oxidoreductase RnfE subunit [Nocardioides ginsengisegetis]